jgi:protein-tyrosine phosphatase
MRRNAPDRFDDILTDISMHDAGPTSLPDTDRPAPILPGIPNFRDLGGLPAQDGKHLRLGRIFRSQSLDDASQADEQALIGMDVRLVCDLRSVIEREKSPTRWPGAQPVFLNLSVDTDVRARNNDFLEQIRADPSIRGVERGMLVNYRNMPEAFLGVFPGLFAHLLDEKHLPAVIHCHAGKDRTGFICAVLLLALGVSKSCVYEDYLRTGHFVDSAALAAKMAVSFSAYSGVALKPEDMLPVVEVRRQYLDIALDCIDSRHGGLDRYLEIGCGLSSAQRMRLGDLLLA